MSWQARYPDLAGKVVVVTGDPTPVLAAVASAAAANGALVAAVTDDRDAVDAAVGDEDGVVPALGFRADPADGATWERVRPHLEQRLGPIDVVVVVGDAAADAVDAAFVPDMTARSRGRVVTVSSSAAAAVEFAGQPGVHRARVTTVTATTDDVVAAVLFAASDVTSAARLAVRLDAPA